MYLYNFHTVNTLKNDLNRVTDYDSFVDIWSWTQQRQIQLSVER